MSSLFSFSIPLENNEWNHFYFGSQVSESAIVAERHCYTLEHFCIA